MLGRPLINFQPLYKNGIHAIQETFEYWHARKIEELERKIQMSFLEIVENGKMKDPTLARIFDSELFDVRHNHSMQGCYK